MAEQARERVLRPVARDLERVLMDLADDFPLLASLVEHRRGTQQRLPTGTGRIAGAGPAYALSTGAPPQPHEVTPASAPSPAPSPQPEFDTAASSANTMAPRSDVTLAGADGGRPRPIRYGIRIQFEERPEDTEPARLIESTVWVNAAHPAYRRAAASRSEGYHIALASALALAPLAVEPAKEHAFVTAFLGSWGSAIDRRKPGPRKSRRR